MFTLSQMGLNVDQWIEFQQDLRKLIYKRYLEGSVFFIAGNTPSLKNEQEIAEIYTKTSLCCHAEVYRIGSKSTLRAICSKCQKQTRLKRPIIVHKPIVKKYQKETEPLFLEIKKIFLEIKKTYSPPYILGFYFVRDSERRFDYINAMHIVLDLLQSHEMLSDDDTKQVLPIPLGYEKDAEEPGVYFMFISNKYHTNLMEIL